MLVHLHKPESESHWTAQCDSIAILLLGLQWHQRLVKKKTIIFHFNNFFFPINVVGSIPWIITVVVSSIFACREKFELGLAIKVS